MTDRNQTKESPEKKAAGIYAASLVKNGDKVGLGTGSTVAYTIQELGRRVHEEKLNVIGVVTSYQSEAIAIAAGVSLTTLSAAPQLDIAIDGADQFDEQLNAIKGGGAAHTREKIVAMSAKKFIVVSDPSKKAKVLSAVVPIEVMPFGKELVIASLKKMGGVPTLRTAVKKDGPVISDNGNFIVDCDFGEILDVKGLAAAISQIPGVVEHGIFMNVDEVIIGKADGTVEIIRK
jgi:ribose 5-phosphate isomerase A